MNLSSLDAYYEGLGVNEHARPRKANNQITLMFISYAIVVIV